MDAKQFYDSYGKIEELELATLIVERDGKIYGLHNNQRRRLKRAAEKLGFVIEKMTRSNSNWYTYYHKDMYVEPMGYKHAYEAAAQAIYLWNEMKEEDTQ